MIIKKILVVLTILLVMLPVRSFGFEADITEYMTEEMYQNLPENIMLSDKDGVGLIDHCAIIREISAYVSEGIGQVMSSFFVILALIMISTLFSLLCENIGSEAVKKLFSYLSTVCFALVIYRMLDGIWNGMSELFDRIHVMMTAITPSVTILYAIGGNIGTASVTGAGMSVMLTVFEDICNYGIRPILQICFGFSLVSCLSGSIRLEPLSKFVQGVYTTVLVAVISIMTTIMSMQSFLAVNNDTLSVRAIKFASSTAVPIVGGALSDASAGVASSIGVLRSTFGILAVIALCMMVLPTLISIWLNKIAFGLGGALASVFGADREENIIMSACRILNFALAMTFSVTLMFVINLCIFAGSVTALGG